MIDRGSEIPALGASIRHEFLLDPRWLTVNHGSFGATPRIVLAVQDEWRRRMEEQPSRFMRRILPDALRAAASRLARFVGASDDAGGKDLVFVENATVGANATFVGLFGTVWGIMNSFGHIAMSKNTSLAVVAPGISEALFATAIGLVAAIPAAGAYNILSGQVARYAQQLEAFSGEFITILSRQLEEQV